MEFQNHPEFKFSVKDIEEIDIVVKTLYENEQFSGAVLVSVKGKVIYQNAFGFANIEDSIPNKVNTKFRIASFTKPFTVMLILQLMEDGKIELEGKLTDYLPEYTVDGSDKITIYQLLTHTAGITGHPRIPNLIDIEKKYYTRKELLELIMSYDLIYEPGIGREYSNFGFALLGLVIEKVTGKPYDEVLNEKICIPAGMTNTFSDVTDKEIENRAIGYTYNYFTGPERASYLDMSFCLGAGQLLSTVKDLFLFDQALYTDKLLSEKSKELFFNEFGWLPVRYPYGIGSKRILCNNLEGSINGFQSHTQRIDKDSVLIVALRNIKEAVYENQIVIKWPSAIASPILSILYDEEYDITKKSGAFEVFKTLIESGRNKAENKYFNIINGLQDKYYIDDREFDFFEKELRYNSMEKLADEYRKIRSKI
jgi:CubicO group peptidase (beta-lactamase class C family)